MIIKNIDRVVYVEGEVSSQYIKVNRQELSRVQEWESIYLVIYLLFIYLLNQKFNVN